MVFRPSCPPRRSRVRAVAFALGALSIVVGVALSPGEAAGQKTAPPKAQPDGGTRYDPNNVTGISKFMETVVQGTAKYEAKELPAAVDLFKKAVQLNPRDPLGSYLLGEAYLATDNLGEAEAAFKAAAELENAQYQVVHGHVLFAIADVYERQKKWEQARAAWKVYSDFATKLGSDDAGALAHPKSGAARIKAIDDWMKLDKDYEIVRQRIAAEKADAGAAAEAGKTAPKKK